MEKYVDPRGNPPGYFNQGQPRSGAYPPPPQQYGYQQQQGFSYPNGQRQQPSYGTNNNVHVITQQPVTAVGGVAVKFSDHMTISILSCLCCVWPIGVCAIFKSFEARSAHDRGDVISAEDSASQAQGLALISVFLGVMIIVIVVILRFTVLEH